MVLVHQDFFNTSSDKPVCSVGARQEVMDRNSAYALVILISVRRCDGKITQGLHVSEAS